MNLTELVDEVYVMTSRSDLTAQSEQAVKLATLKLHGRDYYYKDLVGATLLLPSAEYIQSFDYKTVFPRWRNIKYLRKYDTTAQEATKFFEIIPTEFVTDGYSVNREDVCYMAGSLLNIRSSTPENFYLIGYYQHPDITTANWDSWIANEIPYAIVTEAARRIFKIIGKDDEYARLENDMREYYAQIDVVGLANTGGY